MYILNKYGITLKCLKYPRKHLLLKFKEDVRYLNEFFRLVWFKFQCSTPISKECWPIKRIPKKYEKALHIDR